MTCVFLKVFHPSPCRHHEMETGTECLQQIVTALACGVNQFNRTALNMPLSATHQLNTDMAGTVEDLSLENISTVCRQAQLTCPGLHSSFWEQLRTEIEAAHNEMTAVRHTLEEVSGFSLNRDQSRELGLLSSVYCARVHVGVILTQLLLPTSVDPVSIHEIQYQCYQELVCVCFVLEFVCVCTYIHVCH